MKLQQNQNHKKHLKTRKEIVARTNNAEKQKIQEHQRNVDGMALNFKQTSVSPFFPLPKAIFHIGLTAEEIAVYAYLMYCEDRTTYQCYPSYSTIGEAVGMSKNTVKKYVDELRKS